MKNLTTQLKKAFMVIVFFTFNALITNNLIAQNYFTSGQNYTFRCIVSETQTRIINVVFDAAGNANFNSSLEAIGSNDKEASYSFAPSSEINYNETNNTISISQNIDKYYIIYFTDPTITPQAAPLGGSVTISCGCTKALDGAPMSGATCKVAYTKEGSCYCFSCVVGGTCADCKLNSTSSNNNPNNKFLILKANSINNQ